MASVNVYKCGSAGIEDDKVERVNMDGECVKYGREVFNQIRK